MNDPHISRLQFGSDSSLTGEPSVVGERVVVPPILPDIERHRIIQSFNATQEAYSCQRLIHELFEDQVRHTPDAVALMHEERCPTYAEINRRANQLARWLRDKGVGQNELVGICVQRSVDMVVDLLGILKAGAAYVPLDPNYPPERLKYMLDDAAPRIVLTQKTLKPVLPGTQAEVIELDAKVEEFKDYSPENISVPELGLTAENLVYVIYTSGSTGQPKGTAMSHRSMVNLIEWHRKTFQTSAGIRVLQFAALSFDVAFQELFSTLCAGGTVVLLDEWIRRDAGALTELLSSRSIERLFLPPLMLQSLAEFFKSTGVVPGSLQDVITAGEQLRVSPEIADFFKHLNGCRLHNHYGPTESHVVTAFTLAGDPEEWPAFPSIGQPISNTQIYILDRYQQLLPIGVAGEIYIGGANVARGYLNRPELTAQRFIADPFAAVPNSRMYKTGDLGRWQADGSLEYLGREDGQVKIRGYRIELGEIEAQLRRHVQVKEAAVLMREDAPGEKRLVAYITRRDLSGPHIEELRAYVKSVLPEYMVPSAFVILECLPLTPTGKLDRRALPSPRVTCATLHYEPPQGEMEETLAQIWQELLQVERVGGQDDFFELGGDSLSAMQVVARIRSSLFLDMPVSLLFTYPKLQEFSSQVEDLRQARLLGSASESATDAEGLLERVAAISEKEVRQLLDELKIERRH